jgi:transcriptional regulator with XRE-family HTH domain
MTYDTTPSVETLWTHGQWGRAIKAWRKKVGWSAQDLAKALNPPVTRSYIKHLESQKKPWTPTPRVEKQLHVLMRDTPAKLPVSKLRILVSRFHIPQRVYVNIPPRRCRGHNRPAFMATNQVYCGTSKRERAMCEKLWRRKEDRKTKED